MIGRGRAWCVVAVVVWATTAASAACTLPAAPLPALAAAVRLLEPALPRTLVTAGIELPPEHPHYEDLLYLRERRVLPRGVEADALSPEAWQGALDVIAGWYDLPGVAAGDPADDAAVAADLASLLAQVRRAVRPAALIAWTPEDRSQLAFRGLVWNWSAYPRLVVWRVDPEDDRVGTDLRAAARTLSTCAYEVDAFVAASAPVARDLFLAENRARMYLVGSEPDLPGAWPMEVPAGEEVEVFAFTHPLVASLDAYSAVFVGDAAPLLTMARLLPQVRTNLSPIGLARLLALPPR
jgi:hypothetical protein